LNLDFTKPNDFNTSGNYPNNYNLKSPSKSGFELLGKNADHLSFFMLGATVVQHRFQSMEIIDFMDKMTPAYDDSIDL